MGRGALIREFEAALSGSDHLRSRVLAGPAGVGKTRLATEFADLAESFDYSAVRVIGTMSGSRIPLGALSGLLSGVPEQWVGDRHPPERMFALRAAIATLRKRAKDRPIVLVVDDAHLLDEASATVVQELAANRDVTVIATIRSRESSPEAIVGLWKDGIADRIDLEPLTFANIEDLLTKVLGGPIDAAAVRALARRSGGNVLFLRELIQSALADHSLHTHQDLWRWSGTIAPSARLIELVNARLSGVDEDERRVLEYLAIGEPLSGTELATLSDLAVVERLEQRELVTSAARPGHLEVRLAHPLYADVLRDTTPALRVRSMKRDLAAAAESMSAPDDSVLLKVALWRLDTGEADARTLLRAVDAACNRIDFELAERFATAAVESGAGFDAELRLAQIVGLQGRLGESEERLRFLQSTDLTDDQRARVALTLLDSEGFFLGRPAEALEIAESAISAVADDRWRTELTARRTTLVLALQGPAASARAAAPLLTFATGNALSWASMSASFSLGRMGKFADAINAADIGIAASAGTEHTVEWQYSYHHFHRCEAIALGGNLTLAAQTAQTLYDDAIDSGSVEAQACFALALCKLAALRGRFDAAIRVGREAAALYRELGRPQFQVWSLQHLAHAHALAGRGDEATRLLQQLNELGVTNESMAVDLTITHAWTELVRKNRPGCLALLAQAFRHATRTGDLVGAAFAVHAQARLGDPGAHLAAITKLAASIEGDFVATLAQHVSALAHGDPNAADRSSRMFEKIGADYLAAQAAADALEMVRRAREPYGAGPAWDRARALAARIDTTDLSAFTGAKVRVNLTSAELRVARLAARGMPNKKIAAELKLSVRTVETHLQRVYRKLGVSSRTELTLALPPA